MSLHAGCKCTATLSRGISSNPGDGRLGVASAVFGRPLFSEWLLQMRQKAAAGGWTPNYTVLRRMEGISPPRRASPNVEVCSCFAVLDNRAIRTRRRHSG
jgi:hypothetical protein